MQEEQLLRHSIPDLLARRFAQQAGNDFCSGVDVFAAEQQVRLAGVAGAVVFLSDVRPGFFEQQQVPEDDASFAQRQPGDRPLKSCGRPIDVMA
ncbi:MAG: hypothetical protein R3C20_00300 [Planctomycetaceae bacterium]